MQERTSIQYLLTSMCATVALLTGCTGNSPVATQPDSTIPTEIVISSAPPSSSPTITPTTRLADTTELIASVATGFGYSGQSGISVYVFADGRVVSTDPKTKWGFSEFTIAASKVDEIRKLAAERKLLEIRDTGDPGVTDQDFLIVKVPGPTGTIKQSIYAPNFTTGLTDSQKNARTDISGFAAALYALPNLAPAELVNPLHAYNPNELQVFAYPVLPIDPNDEPEPQPVPVAWGATQTLTTLFAQDDCIVMTGDDARWLRDAAIKASTDDATPESVVVPSSLISPALIRLVAVPAETAPYECPNDTPNIATTTWSATDRTVASPSDRWIALHALYQYAYDQKLDAYSSEARLSYLTLQYAHIVDAGQTLVDLIGTDENSSTSPFEVAMRINTTTGKVVQFTKNGEVTP
jgi:hypothetical protein